MLPKMQYLPQILQAIKKRDYVPLPADRLAEKLGLPSKDFGAFQEELNRHFQQGTLVKLKKNRICLPRDADLITGTIRFRAAGSAQLFPDISLDGKSIPPLQIRAEDTHVAMHGDHVLCRIIPKHKAERFRKRANRNLPEGDAARVIRILERKRTRLAGTLRKSRMFYFVIPDDPRITQDILVPDPAQSHLQPKPKIDDKVLVNLLEWEQRHLSPEGEIVEILGKTHTPGAEFKALLLHYDLDPEFPSAVMAEAEAFPKKVPKAHLKGRVDLRKTDVFTIDPQDAKDFDDALSIEQLPDGLTRVGVHIADVSSYVQPGTALDNEARQRGNSTYLVGTTIPMLPHAISNGLCSLVEGEDRLTKSVFITYAKGAKVVKTEFANSVIRSRKRLTYEQAYALMFEDDFSKIRALPVPPKHQTGSTGRALADLKDAELSILQTACRQLWEIAKRLRSRRMKTGSLDLDMPETKIFVNEEGYADRIVKIEYDESHQLIEEFMLAANESVARALNEKRIPAIHRVHEKPDPERLDELSTYMGTVGIEAGDLSTKKNILALLKKIRAHPQAHMLRIQFLRSLKQANYRASPDGHYGLGKHHYAHFTSPIRRYSDLIVHRIFARHLVSEQSKQSQQTPAYNASRLGELAQHLSITEQNSTEAERESVKIKLLEFFERQIADKQPRSFQAVIMDVRNHGFFVELTESMAYGLVHASTLTDDLYRLNNEGNAFVGRRSRKSFHVGDSVSVVPNRVDRFKRQIDFALSEAGPEETKSSASKSPKTKPKNPPSPKSQSKTGKKTHPPKQNKAKTSPKKHPRKKRNRGGRSEGDGSKRNDQNSPRAG
jgi:ribonuclease R